MVFNHCTVCAVYGPDGETQKRIPVYCAGEQITLLPGTEHELSDSAKVRIDFFDSQIGYVQTECRLAVRKNDDPAIQSAWVADCSILEVLQIREMRRFIRVGLGKEVVMTLLGKGDFEALIQNISEGGLFCVDDTGAVRGYRQLFVLFHGTGVSDESRGSAGRGTAEWPLRLWLPVSGTSQRRGKRYPAVCLSARAGQDSVGSLWLNKSATVITSCRWPFFNV